jgi:hypothetical protein
MPTPVSYTSMRTLVPNPLQPTRMRPPGWVYLIAFADQIPQSGAQQEVIADDPVVARHHSHANAFAQRRMFMLAAGLPQHLMQADRLELKVRRVISNLQRNLDLLQLLLEAVDRPPAALQPPLLRARSDSEIEMIVGTFNGLDRAKQIFTGHLEQHRLMP